VGSLGSDWDEIKSSGWGPNTATGGFIRRGREMRHTHTHTHTRILIIGLIKSLVGKRKYANKNHRRCILYYEKKSLNKKFAVWLSQLVNFSILMK
jgi:hypothetical protein